MNTFTPTSAVADGQKVADKKKKKKKKKHLPKDLSVQPDPERWIPLKERSTYKRKGRKGKANEIGKGAQGAVEKKIPEKEKLKPSTSSSSLPSSTGVTPSNPNTNNNTTTTTAATPSSPQTSSKSQASKSSKNTNKNKKGGRKH